MDQYGGLPTWWQWFIPTYKNWGGPGWSAGRWNGDPDQTDWTVATTDAVDESFKQHDEPYQSGGNRDFADLHLVAALLNTKATGRYCRYYRWGAIILFTMWPFIRHLGRSIYERKWRHAPSD